MSMRPWRPMKMLGTTVGAQRGRPLVKPQDPAILRGDMDQQIEHQAGHARARPVPGPCRGRPVGPRGPATPPGGAPRAEAAGATRAAYRGALDRRPRPPPVLEWGLRALEYAPPPVSPVLVHGDFRIGNVLVEAGRLTGVLDWEFARWSDPHEDLGWVFFRYWRRQACKPPPGAL